MARAIDADELIKKAWDADTRVGYVQVVDVGDIEEAPTIDPVKQSWISVKDRLPEDDLPEGSKTKRIKVLVAIKKDNGQWIIRSQTRVKDGFRYWQESGWDWGKHSYGEFTHWMPLPEPPKEEE